MNEKDNTIVEKGAEELARKRIDRLDRRVLLRVKTGTRVGMQPVGGITDPPTTTNGVDQC